jgi:sialate O-acetylesterase
MLVLSSAWIQSAPPPIVALPLPFVHPLFSNDMILQRDMKVPLWGWSAPGDKVSILVDGKIAGEAAVAGKEGKWMARIGPFPAGGPHEIVIEGGREKAAIKNVLFGEVWLCSGQSNMGLEMRKLTNAAEEMAAATNPNIRAFTAQYAAHIDNGYTINPSIEAKRYALRPQEICLGSWKVSTPANVANLSGIAYFFARDLNRKLEVPVGIIVSSVGATAIEAWTSLEGLKAIPAYHERAVAFEELATAFLNDKSQYPKAIEQQKERLPEKEKKWFAMLDAQEPGLKDQWMAPLFDTSKWARVSLPVSVDDNPLGAPVASIWFRKDVTIPHEWVGQELELHLGRLDAVDESYFNGSRVGRTWFDTAEYWNATRFYSVPATMVKTTQVALVLRLLKLQYPMGVFGPAEEMKLVLKSSPDKAPVSLVGDWKMQKSQDLDPGLRPQLSPMITVEPGNHYGQPGVQYNGLIHPLIPYAIRGAIWYQGEANAPFYADYRSLMPGLIKSWREEWGQGDFPFGIIQLADYFGQQTKPVERFGGYCPLRESQAYAAKITPNTFIATAVGVGEGKDIHPKNKREVSRRLALAAMGTVYGKKELLHYGPIYKAMKIEGDKMRLEFDFARGLHADGDPPVGFAIAGEDRAFYFAKAKIEGETIMLWSEKVPKPIAARYAWATNPVCNIYNAENLPISQFHTDNWDDSQLVVPADTITIPSGWVPK